MRIRNYRAGDLDTLKALHAAQGFEYLFPSMGEFCLAQVIENGSQRPDTALLLRKSAEAYLLIDPKLAPQEKMERLLLLNQEVPAQAAGQGIREVYALIPPPIEEQFQKRLFELGWQKKLWPFYVREVQGG